MGILKKDILIGFLISLFATAAGIFFYLEFFTKLEFYDSLDFIIKEKLIGKVLSMAAIPNLFVFFIYLKKKQDYRAKGVLFGVIAIVFLTLLLKFI